MEKMNQQKEYEFPYLLGDGGCNEVKWEGNILTVIFDRYYVNAHTPNVIKVRFHGVDWIRSTCWSEKMVGKDYIYGFNRNHPRERYPLIDRELLNKDCEPFVCNLLSGISYLDEHTVFIDDIMFFPCTEIEIVRAVCARDIDKAIQNLI